MEHRGSYTEQILLTIFIYVIFILLFILLFILCHVLQLSESVAHVTWSPSVAAVMITFCIRCVTEESVAVHLDTSETTLELYAIKVCEL